LPANGTYTIVIQPIDNQSDIPWNVTVTLSTNGPPANVLIPGSPTNIILNNPYYSVPFVFTGIAGQYATVTQSQSTLPRSLTFDLYDPNGTGYIGNTTVTGNGVGPVLLGGSQTYGFAVSEQYQATGNATVTLSLSSPQSGGTISPGVPAPFTFSAPGQSIQFTFSGVAGQLVSASIPSSTVPQQLWFAITNPDGTTLVTTTNESIAANFAGPAVLPVNGTYILTVSAGGQSGDGNVVLWQFANQAGLSIDPQVPKQVTFGIPGQNVQMSFTGKSGQNASVQLSNINFTGRQGSPAVLAGAAISIVNPDGTTLTSNKAGPAYGLNTVRLPVNGTYTLVIVPRDGATGNAIVNLNLQ